MATLATLIVKLAADIGGFSAEMEKAELKAVRAAERMGKAWKRTGDQLAGVGSRMTTTLTLPIVAGAALSIKAASDEAESWNKVTVVFGENADAIKTWAADSATSLGVSRNAAYQAAGSFGNLFTTVGVAPELMLDMSTSLVKLSGDLASFHNADPTEVMKSIQSALVGQVEPMRKYGVMLTQDAIAAKALELGLVGANEEMSDAAKMQAIYAIIMEQTKTAQGDFLNTSDGLANQMRILKADFENTASSLGQMLLPYALQLLGWVREAVAWFSALDPSIQRNILVVLGLVAVLGPLLVVIGSVVGAIGTLIPIFTAIAGAVGAVSAPVLIVVGVIIAALALLYAAWQNNWGGIREKTAAIWEGIKSAIATAWQFIQNAIQAAMTVIGPLMQAFQAAREGDWRAFGEKLREAWDNAWKLIGQIASTAWENLKTGFNNLIEAVVSFFRDTDWGQVGRNIIEGIANGIKNSIDWIMDAARSAANAALEAAKGFLGIQSPSTVFETQVGWEMGRGQIAGYENSLEKLMPATVPSFAIPNMAGGYSANLAGAGVYGGGSAGGGTVFNINVVSDGVMDERDVARKIAGAVGVLLRERGLA